MKIPITDQFLWDLLSSMSKAEDVFRFLIHPPRTFGQIVWDSADPVYQKYRKILKPQKFARLMYHLKSNNLIKSKNLENKKAIFLTKKGLGKALKASFKIVHQKKRADGKWIMVIFDIPQNHKKARDLLRSVLKNLGYKMFQQSVWITPYDVSEKTENLLQAYSLDGYVKIFIIEKLD